MYCALGVENKEYYYIGLNKDFDVVEKLHLEIRENKINKHNETGNRKTTIKSFCVNNNKKYISNLIILVDSKVKNIKFLETKFKGL